MRNKKIVGILTTVVVVGSIFLPTGLAFADGFNVISMGANLTTEQKDEMLKYFNAPKGSYEEIRITNKQEREELNGIIPVAQIGNKTISCAYVQPTEKGGINVKTANLTYVTASMITNALTTAGIYNANVIAAAPFQVSGTGALTGVMTGFEKASGEEISSEKKELANTELKVTTNIADDENVGQDKAAAIVNGVKAEVIQNGNQNQTQVAQIINNITNNYGVTLSKEQEESLNNLMQKISKQDYNKNAMEKTLDKIKEQTNQLLQEQGELKGFLNNLKVYANKFINWVKDLFNSKDKNIGIVNDTNNDTTIGENAITTGNSNAVEDVNISKENDNTKKEDKNIENKDSENQQTDINRENEDTDNTNKDNGNIENVDKNTNTNSNEEGNKEN
ncbi:DUF1002 domain-containing protein [uncultured Clostridium sp.]|uniref:DUF1002 domain-containing protein n=1 Tax=uncultured Clostridium sp. TaxID=59620 RepID=UPI0026147897|nr:DUF1002 domain-containing protein [uncultured Clostridium sp.]